MPLISGVGKITARLYVPRVGWTTQMSDATAEITRNDNNVRVPQFSSALIARALTGLEASPVGAPSRHVPVRRMFAVGE